MVFLGYLTKASMVQYKKLEYSLQGRNTPASRDVLSFVAHNYKKTQAVESLMIHMDYTGRTYRALQLQALTKGCKKSQFYMVVAGPESTLKKTIVLTSKGILEFPIMNISGI